MLVIGDKFVDKDHVSDKYIDILINLPNDLSEQMAHFVICRILILSQISIEKFPFRFNFFDMSENLIIIVE